MFQLVKRHTLKETCWSVSAYLEVQDDGPDEAEGELGVAVHDLIAADVHQLDLYTYTVYMQSVVVHVRTCGQIQSYTCTCTCSNRHKTAVCPHNDKTLKDHIKVEPLVL